MTNDYLEEALKPNLSDKASWLSCNANDPVVERVKSSDGRKKIVDSRGGAGEVQQENDANTICDADL